MIRPLQAFAFTTLLILSFSSRTSAQEWLCDTQFEDCRAPLLNLIRQETQGIDVAFWFMEDSRYITELVKKHQAGVPVRVLVDSRANASKRLNEQMLIMLRDAGIPMREKYAGGDILHFKMMLFHGQDIVEFSKANFTGPSFVPIVPNANFFDEVIFFTGDDNLTNTFRRRFEDLWTNTSMYRNYANITSTPTRRYPVYPIHSSMNFPPIQNFSDRSVSRYNAETQGIDAIVFRVTDHRHANAVMNAVARGVPVRLITEPTEYRNPTRMWHAKHVDRMYMGGVQIKHRKHEGLMHQGSVVMHGLGEVIFGSSNWTTTSAIWQDEHNYFYNPGLGKPWFFQYFADQFERKWNDATNYTPFQPLPPDTPVYSAPTNGASGLGTSVTLTFEGGPWAHLYDIYLGTDPTNLPLVATDHEFIDGVVAGRIERFTVSSLQPGTTYYWRIVGKTWAQRTKTGPMWSFSTGGTAPGGGTPTGGHTPFGGSPAAIPGTFQAENFDNGGQGVAYFDTTAGNSGATYRSTDVDISGTTDAGGGYNIGWTKAGEWLKYTVDVATTDTYTFEARVASTAAGARFHVEVNGVDRTGPISVPGTGSWQTWQTVSVTAIPLSAGQAVIRVVFDAVSSTTGASGNFNWFRFVQGTSNTPTSSTPFGGTLPAIPTVFQAENFDNGGQGLAYFDTTAGNFGGTYRSTDVDISGTTDAGGGYNIAWTKAGEWLKYSVTVTTTGTYTFQARVASEAAGGSFHVEVDGVDRTGSIAVPSTGAWQAWTTISVPGIPLSAGQRVIRVVFDAVSGTTGATGNFNWFGFVQE